jgi:hypothetical protein
MYFKKLNEYTNANSLEGTIPESSVHEKALTKESYSRVKSKTEASESNATKNKKLLPDIREELKYIKRYIGLHDKVESPHAILSFIKALQRSIVQKIIRKTSPLAGEIEMIQNKLVHAYNKMKGDESFSINEKDLNHVIAIAGGEEAYASITAIKRYIELQGSDDQKKINDLIRYLENLVEKKKLSNDDPYADKVNAIYKTLKQRRRSKVSISKTELSRLERIMKACGSHQEVGKIYDVGGKLLRRCKNKTYSDASRGACSHNKGLNGVLTAEEMANRKLDLLNFSSFWYSLFGNPAWNFTMMFHGEPHNGKTIFLLKLAQYLAETFGKVLYVSSEEFASPTMTKKVNEFLNPLPTRLHFAENLQDPDLSSYQFIIMDSVNDLGLKINEYKELRKVHPEKAFIFILQHTKAGDFKGGKDWEHIAEIAGEVHKGVASITKNRYAPKSTLDFFKQFGLEWQEPAEKQKLKPYPISGDLTTTDNQHY